MTRGSDHVESDIHENTLIDVAGFLWTQNFEIQTISVPRC